MLGDKVISARSQGRDLRHLHTECGARIWRIRQLHQAGAVREEKGEVSRLPGFNGVT
jgi:hypothetical protein